ncbi:sugar phosphate isomerase/epimerase family protein [Rubrimonas cliftonensis]|uniref:Xylose isomerase n=1 Tax=Rubrimonas cliftonensis TaxID=89524 RepID=A0A1H4CDP3_9RHOB|nr:sugar phosphate isomerase/epimerase family protein [Rubrimonas cliftonensis]SEA58458.1 xylose isomerase [Rubrimonas cliftonensis]
MSDRPNRPRYAARLNAFGARDGVAEMIRRAGAVPGLDAADLNFPDHVEGHAPQALGAMLSDAGLALNGFAMRYYGDPRLKLGAFTHPDAAIRQAAVDLTRRGLDALAATGGRLMTVWAGQDGWDYAFQADHARMWDMTAEALAAIADHNRQIEVSVEYKPNEPRAFSVLPDMATTLLMLSEVRRDNLGVTLDFAHALYAGESPARAATLAARSSRLLGVHLNDGYGKRDDGLIAGAVHPAQTVELFVALERIGHDGVIYFDTFPDASGTDAAAEAGASIALVEKLRAVARTLAADPELAAATARQDAPATQRLLARALYGA